MFMLPHFGMQTGKGAVEVADGKLSVDAEKYLLGKFVIITDMHACKNMLMPPG